MWFHFYDEYVEPPLAVSDTVLWDYDTYKIESIVKDKAWISRQGNISCSNIVNLSSLKRIK